MRTFGFLALILLWGCGSAGERKLRGTWVLDTQETVDAATDETPQPGAKPSGLNIFLNSLAANVRLELEFEKDGSVVTRRSILGNGVSESRQWQLTAQKDGTFLLRLSDDQFQTYDEWLVAFIDTNHFKAKVFGHSLSLTFRREKP